MKSSLEVKRKLDQIESSYHILSEEAAVTCTTQYFITELDVLEGKIEVIKWILGE